jgi:hypothetical protein
MKTNRTHRVSKKFRSRLPDILFEIGSVVLAVLLALAVNEWRQNRQNKNLAKYARRSIVAELQSNQSELRGSLDNNRLVIARFRGQIDSVEKGILHGIAGTGINVAQLTSSAWKTAQAAQALRYMDFDWLLSASRMYDMQELFVDNQKEMIRSLGEMGQPSLIKIKQLQGRLDFNQQLGDSLYAEYGLFLTRSDSK